MKHYVANFLKRLATFLELTIAMMMSVGIILLCLRIASNLTDIPNLDVWPNFTDLMETCFNLIIGVELIRMMYSHSPDTVFEVLLFAIARQIIIDHSSIWGSLTGVCAIAALFATRKYLFCEFDVSDEIILRSSMKAKSVARILDIQLPHKGDETLLDVFLEKCEEYNIDVGVGACVYFTDFGLRAAKTHDGKISRIEVIRSIH